MENSAIQEFDELITLISSLKEKICILEKQISNKTEKQTGDNVEQNIQNLSSNFNLDDRLMFSCL